MRHLHAGRKLNRPASHRNAMLSNLAVSVLDKERVVTTVAKAKEVRGTVERLITYGKAGSLHHIRLAARIVKDKAVLDKLFKDIAPSYKDREGGYVRVLRMGERRGDNAMMAMIQLVGRNGEEKPKKKKKKAAAPKAAPVETETAEAPVEAAEKKPAAKKTATKKAKAEEASPKTEEKKAESSAPEKAEEKSPKQENAESGAAAEKNEATEDEK